MKTNFFIVFLILAFKISFLRGQNERVLIRGRVLEVKSSNPVEHAIVRLSGTPFLIQTNKSGEFSLLLPRKSIYKITVSHLSLESFTKEVKRLNEDTLSITVFLNYKSNLLDTVPIVSKQVPETLVGKPFYSVFDFDFYEDKLILLTSESTLNKAQLQLSDYEGKIVSYYKIPKRAGEAKHFFHDYEGYTELICEDTVLRLDVFNSELIVNAIPKKEFESYVKPVLDTMQGNLYYSNQWDKYPSFNYYYLKKEDTLSRLLNTITNKELLDMYNFEYYFLPSGMQLEARRMADDYKTDKRIIAALLSGFTQSMFYEPLYAPLFVINDTICIFNHYNDYLYHYNKQNALIDSVKISYHHPKNWRDWKRQLYVDEAENKVYAFFSKNGHHYLKQIHHQTGKEILTYRLQHHSAEKIKIKDGYVYYIYRPFGSTQERFLYRERIQE